MSKHFSFSILALVAFILSACGGKESVIEIQTIAISQPSAELIIGETLLLKATVSPSNASYDGMSWTSTKPKVASVSESGLVSALSEGNTTVTVMIGGKTASCSVTVVSGFVAVSSINLNKSLLEMVEGDTETLTATVSPDDATDKTITWTSSKEGVATVKDGVVSAISAGETTITAQAGDKASTCKVVVAKRIIAVESITLNKTDLNLIKGNEESLVATIKPDDASDKSVIWTSNAPSIASVDETGKVRALNGGNATITAKAGDKTATCAITVTVPVESVSLNKVALTLTKGESETLTATVKPDDATNKKVTWSSSDDTIVSVDQNGKVTAVKGGEAIVTAKADEKTATCTVSVFVPVESITISHSSITLIEGQSFNLTATVYPQDATDKTINWSSNYPDIVSVEDGYLTALAKGQATITASSGNYSASCTVVVMSEADLDLENNVSVRLSSQTSYGIAIVNGAQFYSRKYTITNSSIVDIYVYSVTAPNCSYFSYPQSLGSGITYDMTKSIGSSLGTVKAGSTFEFTLYCTVFAAPTATIYFRYNGHQYQVSGQ